MRLNSIFNATNRTLMIFACLGLLIINSVHALDSQIKSDFSFHYDHTDHLGNILLSTDDHGDIVWPLEDDHLSDSQGIHTYRPYGNTDYETDNWDENNPFGTFTGKENDRIPTGDHGWGDYNMMDFGARHYLPHLAVFASPDPVSGDPANPLSWNRYAYCLNNPVRYVDPDGRLIFDFQEVKRDFNIVRAAGKEGTGYLLPALAVARTAGGVADDILLATGIYGAGKQLGKIGFKGFARLLASEKGAISIGKEAIEQTGVAISKEGLVIGKHAAERMAERGVTEKMVRLAIEKGNKYWDPKNKAVSYILEEGFASGKSLLVGQNPVTGKITTVIKGETKKILKKRFIPVN